MLEIELAKETPDQEEIEAYIAVLEEKF
ncbi:unnamed protein product, partial [Allacma fusca]